MATLKETAMAYEPKTTPTIDEAGIISLDFPTQDREKKDKDGKPYKYKVALIGDSEYRVPDSVLEAIKALIEAKPTISKVKVAKKGTGLDTKYTVVPMD